MKTSTSYTVPYSSVMASATSTPPAAAARPSNSRCTATRRNAVQDCEFPLTTGTDAAVDLVILDVILPDINGFDVCRWIKHALSPFLPIILVSGYDHVRGIEAGADYFVAKPINFDEFIAKISMLLERKFQYNTQITSISSSRDGMLPENAFPVVGDRLGDFEIEATLDWGGSTVIYRARNTVDNETYAVKILAHHAAKEEVADRFEREICMMQSVIHHNIIRVHSTGRSRCSRSSSQWMRYCKGLENQSYVYMFTALASPICMLGWRNWQTR